MDFFKEIRTSLFNEPLLLPKTHFSNVSKDGYMVDTDYFEDDEIPIHCPYYDNETGDLKHFHQHDVYQLFEKSGYEPIRFHITQNHILALLRNEYERVYLFTRPCEISLRLVLEYYEYGELEIELNVNGFSTLAFYRDEYGKIRHLKLEEINALFVRELNKEEFRAYVKGLVKETIAQMEREKNSKTKPSYYS